MKTRITELLGIQYPIIQGGMASGGGRFRCWRPGTDRWGKRSWRGSPGRDPQGKRTDR